MRINIFVIICCLFLSCKENTAQTFKTQQKRYKRVRTAYKEKEKSLKELLKEKSINSFDINILIVAYKDEEELKVWIKKKTEKQYQFLKKYDFCSNSGVLGPKRQQGDLQIPEGFYHIDIFNPFSNFYLSLRVSYPNYSDRILGKKGKLGGDIYIHGACCTIGCIPITDDKIKELYLLAIEAKNAGQSKIPVIIFPAKLDAKNFKSLKEKYNKKPKLISLWENLKTGYDFFMKNKTAPRYHFDKKGKYIFK